MRQINHFFLLLFLIAAVACQSGNKPLVDVVTIDQGWQFSRADSTNWLKAKVPGCVHTDLLRNNVIEDPFYRMNEHNVQWVDKLDWVYKTNLSVTAELLKKDRVELNFKGLDTHADVYVNGTKVLTADNMFRGWEIDVKKYLKAGDNELKVYFHSPIKVGLDKYDNYPHIVHSSANDLAEIGQVPGNKWVSPHIRKAQCHFGWDWGPRLVTSGIWQPVYLKAWNQARIADLNIIQNKIEKAEAQLTARFEIESEKADAAHLQINVDSLTVAEANVELKAGKAIYDVKFKITNPKLWWTVDLGDPHMYKVTGTMKTSKGFDKVSHNTGLRTIEVVREKDKDGKSFYLKLNGHKVFMKGANYIPSDAFLDRVTPEKYEKIIKTAHDCHHNMLRVWGGGIYENDIFFDLCDKYGILVWQDFMFACNMYPGHPEFLESVKQEAEYNIRRLRNHPSLALWCGNNEVLAAWKAWGWEKEDTEKDPKGAQAQWKAYKDIFLKVLPDAVTKLDPQRFYHPSSPQAGDSLVNVYNEGDNHYWGVWWGKDEFSKYHTELARFMSEYGFQSFPEMRTVKLYAEPQDYDIYSDVMKSHQRSSIGNGTIDLYMKRDFRKPKDFESFLYVGQVLQADGMKQGMEGHRIAMPYNMGSLYWQINDCWPVASWSSTDYYVRWKAMQYFSKKAFDEVLVAPRVEDNKTLKVYIVSDRLKPIKAQLNLRLVDFTGKVVWKKAIDANIPANTSKAFFEAKKRSFLKGKNSKNLVLVAEVVENGKVLSENKFYFRRVKDLNLPTPTVKTEVSKVANGYQLVITTDKLAKNIFLEVPGKEGFFTDNYFDLLPNKKATIVFETKENIENFKSKLKVRTLRDTYK